MPRRTYASTLRGKPYAVEWPEWFVECAERDCNSHLHISPVGECLTSKEAAQRLRTGKVEDDSTGWKNRKGLWYCSQHC